MTVGYGERGAAKAMLFFLESPWIESFVLELDFHTEYLMRTTFV